MILTLQEIKDYLGITDNSQDSILNFELEYTEDFIRTYTFNKFYDLNVQLEAQADFLNNTITINTSNDLEKDFRFRAGMQIDICNSLLNDGIYQITDVTNNVITVAESLLTENYDDTNLLIGFYRVDYPSWLKKIQAMMIQYDIDTQGKDGIKKEQISRHSIEWADMDSMGASYPSTIISKLAQNANIIKFW